MMPYKGRIIACYCIILILSFSSMMSNLLGPLSPMMNASASITFQDSKSADFLKGTTTEVIVDSRGISEKTVEIKLKQSSWYGGPNKETITLYGSGFHSSENIDWYGGVLALKADNAGWTRHPDAPFNRSEHAAVWDSNKKVMYVTGGTNDSYYKNFDSFSYDPATENWTQIYPLTWGAMGDTAFWDSTDKVMIIYGGMTLCGGTGLYGGERTWIYNPTANTYVQKADAPVMLEFQTGAWDDAHDQMLIYGGGDGNIAAIINSLYSYSPSTDTWTKLASGATPREFAKAAWDPIDKKMFVFGGQYSNIKTGAYANYNELWSYDPSTNKWEMKAYGPPAGAGSRMVWDPVGKRIVMLGSSGVGSSIWAYYPASDSWSPILGGTDAPSSRGYTSLVWDDVRNDAIMFGGWDGNNNLYDVWTWKGQPVLRTSGNVESSTFDTGGNATYTTLSWLPTRFHPSVGSDPLKFQLATSKSSTGPWTYVGPDGTASTYYTTSGQAISPVHNGNRYARYKVFFNSADNSVTPYLNNVTIGYLKYIPGTYTSRIFDAGSPQSPTVWTRWSFGGPSSNGLTIKVRFSLNQDMSQATPWQVVTNGTPINTSLFRYFQYQAVLSGADAFVTPVLKSVTISLNNPPSLTGDGVDQQQGLEGTVFNYTVIYADPDGDAPTSALVYIDNVSRKMTTADTSFKSGCIYIFSTKLALGDHSYYFSFSDGNVTVRFPTSGTFPGPFVDAPPVARLSANRTVLMKGESVAFDGHESTDPLTSVSSYFFEFGDGKDSGSVTDPRINHTYAKSGRYQVHLMVKGGRGLESVKDALLNLTVQARPKAILTFPVTYTEQNKPVNIDASHSTDEDGKLAKYIFDPGDGTAKVETTRYNITHNYTVPGNFTVTLTVIDNDGLESSPVTALVSVAKPPPPPPPIDDGKNGGISTILLLGIVVAVVAVAGVVGFLLYSKRKKAKPQEAPQASVPPPPAFVQQQPQQPTYDPNYYQQQQYYQAQQGNFDAYSQYQYNQGQYGYNQQYPPGP